ncbi:DUF6999 family protein [Aureliella helgolandensis]|uniref:Uncharacterized protein n=1 Tax=Aureliella helgolandensis TaxID=2527968 RepID=A0A518GAS4_9BACT|nr:hypothetical protein [Aureliella helgolandensis]QDV25647.1 hypothetical protein Q31a_39730 [Aureliella helgolandensis]
MQSFPYISDYVNRVFAEEKRRWDFVLLRPLLLVNYFFLRLLCFPFKFVFHRVPYGFEHFVIDWMMSFGMKYLATHDAAELMLRHVQIEPLLYRHVLTRLDAVDTAVPRKLNGIDGDFSVADLETVVRHNMTVGHDLLSYELVDRFDKGVFLDNLENIRRLRPQDHEQYSKAALEENRRCSFQLLGATNIVILVVTIITLFGDLRTTVTALNSFGSDSILLWCLKQIYAHDVEAQIDLDFFMQEVNNRGHYNSSAFFSNPNQYLYYHIVFDEVAYNMLRNRPPRADTTSGGGRER